MTTLSVARKSLAQTLLSRALHLYFLMTRGLTLGVRAIVRSEDGRFLLVRHTYTPGWHFPGGGVEKGETTLAAVEKELRQETGLRLEGRPVLLGIFYNDGVSKRDHVLVYHCAVNTRAIAKPSCPEIAEIGYFDLGDLPEGTDLGTIRRMREMVEGIAPCAAW
jgi:8-oxo-dGTP pyrophosphatase MutT (NUDIX family)